ncbi:MAG: hypothetical protein AVDCRST_MAG87-168, partial [uncultured Thermomicrobiales bacterium]
RRRPQLRRRTIWSANGPASSARPGSIGRQSGSIARGGTRSRATGSSAPAGCCPLHLEPSRSPRRSGSRRSWGPYPWPHRSTNGRARSASPITPIIRVVGAAGQTRG